MFKDDIWTYAISSFTGLDKNKLQRKIVNNFLPISFNICFGCSKRNQIFIGCITFAQLYTDYECEVCPGQGITCAVLIGLSL